MRNRKDTAKRAASALFERSTATNLKKDWKNLPRAAAVVSGFCAIAVFAFLAAKAHLNTGLFTKKKKKKTGKENFRPCFERAFREINTLRYIKVAQLVNYTRAII